MERAQAPATQRMMILSSDEGIQHEVQQRFPPQSIKEILLTQLYLVALC